jgi:hypothetical protein
MGISGIAVIGREGALNDDRYRRDNQRRSPRSGSCRILMGFVASATNRWRYRDCAAPVIGTFRRQRLRNRRDT